MIFDVQNTIARLNRIYLAAIRELAVKDGMEVTAKILGMDITDVEWLVSLDPADIEEIADIGLPLVKLKIPERQKWNSIPRESRKGWAISKAVNQSL